MLGSPWSGRNALKLDKNPPPVTPMNVIRRTFTQMHTEYTYARIKLDPITPSWTQTLDKSMHHKSTTIKIWDSVMWRVFTGRKQVALRVSK